MPELPPRYNPLDVEEPLLAQWNDAGLFHAEPDPKRAPYTIVIPPPNITGILHMGHALNNTIQDILIRFKRMQGFNALWVPGTDHAGIATQNVVEKSLAKEGKRRQDLGREAFLQRVWQWREQYGSTIINQLKRLGASCDWQRTRFTMDDGLSQAVTEVFLRLYNAGLVYRGNYIINWCPRCQTALADEEAPRKETHGKLYHFRYPLSDTPDRSIVVATTRPETMLGDTAVAVHPKDPRYISLIGKTVRLPLVGRELPIIADEAVDPEFGTGAVKVTPAHDPVDFQLGKKHGLEFINVMTDDGRMTNVPQPYAGLDRFVCRKRVLEDLERQELLENTTEHLHNVGHCYRCDTVVEPRLSLQWFVRMKPLAEPAIQAVKDGTITFIPPRWTKVYLNWMENIQDWCISRQIWWGHRIPVWYCDACLKEAEAAPDPRRGIIVSTTAPERCPACGAAALRQDEDVLDTWFSSWLWPFSTLGWPNNTEELRYFYPTTTLVTAPEIIFFWVARMIMAGYVCLGKPPFTTVYIHGTVRDLTGRKMSKSLGNIIDPLEIIRQFGADALRYTLVTSTAVGTDVFISDEKFVVGRNFANKLWNAARFILQAAPEAAAGAPPAEQCSVFDRWILQELDTAIRDTTAALERCHFDEAASRAYEFLWHQFCDWYIEFVKPSIASTPSSQHVLKHVLEQALRLLHPVMPFISEALWQQLQPINSPRFLMVAPWPVPRGERHEEASRQVGWVIQVITAIRSVRAEFRVPAAARVDVTLSTQATPHAAAWQPLAEQLTRLAGVKTLHVGPATGSARGSVPILFDGGSGLIHLGDAIDIEQARQVKQRELAEELQPRLAAVEARLGNEAFTKSAPPEIVQQEREKQATLTQRIATLESYLHAL